MNNDAKEPPAEIAYKFAGEAFRLWQGLLRVRSLRFVSPSATPGWDGIGVGSVVVRSFEDTVLVFTESGAWRPTQGGETQFSNVFRWTLRGDGLISLEHLRYGLDNPVYLFDLAPVSASEWAPVKAYLCNRDCYTAQVRLGESKIRVCWAITGPKKNERIEYTYQ